ncbi:flippase-like domain-containing protein [Candidatus Poribacteria bacterium]|nr:flippase-like domain-containing protein [Candidatus Poribacteria bacterium]
MSRFFYIAFIVSLFLLVLQAVAFWLVMWAYGLRLSFWIGAVVFLIVYLGTALPNAPSNVGTYQFFCVVGLTLFGVEKTLATGFSVVVFILLTFPLWPIGFFALSRSGMTLRTLQNEINRLRKQ